MGVLYLQGKGVPKDDVVGRAWLAKGAEHGSAGSFRTLGMALFNMGIYTESATALQQAVEKAPTNEYVSLWLYLAQARAGKKEGLLKQLESNRSKWKEQKWPATIADLYLGRITEDQFMKLAHDADKQINSEQTCEANFYTAEWYLISDRVKEARPLLQAAVRDCPNDFSEYIGAKAQLALLDAK